ncbi:MAG: hypothetical protein FJ403_17360 [Verrucomicrobia bacterium]|nr:hypothetical protein [Verrucomicrobiota bacterium]
MAERSELWSSVREALRGSRQDFTEVPARRAVLFRVERRHLRLESDTMVSLVRLSATGMFQTLIGMASWLALIRILSGFGNAALAGCTIAIRLVIFALLPSFGLANAGATMAGQNLGAGKPERAEQAVWTAGLYNMIFRICRNHIRSLRRTNYRCVC